MPVITQWCGGGVASGWNILDFLVAFQIGTVTPLTATVTSGRAVLGVTVRVTIPEARAVSTGPGSPKLLAHAGGITRPPDARALQVGQQTQYQLGLGRPQESATVTVTFRPLEGHGLGLNSDTKIEREPSIRR